MSSRFPRWLKFISFPLLNHPPGPPPGPPPASVSFCHACLCGKAQFGHKLQAWEPFITAFLIITSVSIDVSAELLKIMLGKKIKQNDHKNDNDSQESQISAEGAENIPTEHFILHFTVCKDPEWFWFATTWDWHHGTRRLCHLVQCFRFNCDVKTWCGKHISTHFRVNTKKKIYYLKGAHCCLTSSEIIV